MTYGVTWGEGDGPAMSVNATGVTQANFSNTNPAAPILGINVNWQSSGSDISANVPIARPQLVFSTATALGSAGATINADAGIALFDATDPTQVDPELAAAVGTSAHAARRDHRHSIVLTSNTAPMNLGTAASVGGGPFAALEDHVHKSESSGDFFADATGKGFVCRDAQATPHYWRFMVDLATTATGGGTIVISSAGAISATRDGGATGNLIIRIDDVGTTPP